MKLITGILDKPLMAINLNSIFEISVKTQKLSLNFVRF